MKHSGSIAGTTRLNVSSLPVEHDAHCVPQQTTINGFADDLAVVVVAK